jgi:hypothetical protein
VDLLSLPVQAWVRCVDLAGGAVGAPLHLCSPCTLPSRVTDVVGRRVVSPSWGCPDAEVHLCPSGGGGGHHWQASSGWRRWSGCSLVTAVVVEFVLGITSSLSAIARLRRAHALVVCCRHRRHVPLLLLSPLWRAGAVVQGLRSLRSMAEVAAEVEVFFMKLFGVGSGSCGLSGVYREGHH